MNNEVCVAFFVVFSSLLSFDWNLHEEPTTTTEGTKTRTETTTTTTEIPTTTTETTTTETLTTTTETPTTTTTDQTTPKPKISSLEETRSTKAKPEEPEGVIPAKIEVVVTQSLYQIIDETLRERLVNFEARIATLIVQRDVTRDQIEDFEPTFDDDFFKGAFKETDRYYKFF